MRKEKEGESPDGSQWGLVQLKAARYELYFNPGSNPNCIMKVQGTLVQEHYFFIMSTLPLLEHSKLIPNSPSRRI